MARAMDVAAYIINALPVDNLKLQKLLYYCQGVHLTLNDTVLFEDDIEAWQYGPVVPSVYKHYKENGFDLIKPEKCTAKFSETQIEAMDIALAYYGEMSGVALLNKTHQEAPWKNVYREGGKNIVIPVDSIKKFFKENLIISE